MDYLYIFFGLAVFIAVVLLIEGIYTSWNMNYGPEAERIAHRLKVMSAGTHVSSGDVSIVKERLLSQAPAMQRILLNLPRVHSLDRLLVQSGMKIDVAQFLAFTVLCGSISFVVLLFTKIPIWSVVIVSIVAACIPLLIVFSKKQQRLRKIEAQLPDALDLMGRAMRAGHAFPSALQMIGDEMPEPIAGEFRVVFDEVNFGISMQDALKNLSTRIPSTDLNYFVVAVLIQRETGGNLAELLDSISAIIRERFKLLGQIKVLTAEGRLSAWILCLLPFVIGLVLYLVNPSYVTLLWTDTLGHSMLGIALVMMVLGILWMRHLIRIRV